MRCKICELPHKNTSRYELWIERQVCRLCGNLLEFFSWNSNYLKEYWQEDNTKSILDKKALENTKYQHITYYKYNRNESIGNNYDNNGNRLTISIDFLKAMSEMESIDWTFSENFIGFENETKRECVQFIRLNKDRWYVENIINVGKDWEGYYWISESYNKTISDMMKLFFEEMPWFGMLEWKLLRVRNR